MAVGDWTLAEERQITTKTLTRATTGVIGSTWYLK